MGRETGEGCNTLDSLIKDLGNGKSKSSESSWNCGS